MCSISVLSLYVMLQADPEGCLFIRGPHRSQDNTHSLRVNLPSPISHVCLWILGVNRSIWRKAAKAREEQDVTSILVVVKLPAVLQTPMFYHDFTGNPLRNYLFI